MIRDFASREEAVCSFHPQVAGRSNLELGVFLL